MIPSPMTEPESAPERSTESGRATHAPIALSLDVLVVDDDPASRAGLCAAVVALGHRCRGASDGLAALEAHGQRPADVILSDWRMPRIDGMELCRRIRALDAGTYTYLVFTSGHARKRDFVDAVRAGADDYLTKPIDLEDLEARLIAGARVVSAYRQLVERNAALRHDSQAFFRAARVDPLTHVANRLRLEEDLAVLQAEVSRYGHRVVVAMCDIDAFKRYNDRYGHLAGDRALQRVAQAIRGSLRRADRVYRYGGEEFLVVLPEQTPADATAAMERVRAAVEGMGIEHAPGARQRILTLSIGTAPIGDGENSVRDGIARSDKALYRAKAAGGNVVRSATSGD